MYLILALWACTGFSYGGLHVVLFNLYLIRLGYGPEFVGTANSVIMLSLALFSFPAGWIGRRFGCRRVVIAGMGLSVVYALIPIADNIPLQLRPLVILVSCAVFGCAAASVMVAIQPFLIACTVP